MVFPTKNKRPAISDHRGPPEKLIVCFSQISFPGARKLQQADLQFLNARAQTHGIESSPELLSRRAGTMTRRSSHLFWGVIKVSHAIVHGVQPEGPIYLVQVVELALSFSLKRIIRALAKTGDHLRYLESEGRAGHAENLSRRESVCPSSLSLGNRGIRAESLKSIRDDVKGGVKPDHWSGVKAALRGLG